MSNQDYSLTALNKFLEHAAEKGLLNPNTVAGRKAAVNKIFSILDDNENKDLRGINLDDTVRRFANLHGSGFKPDSLRVYLSRIKSTLIDFESYVENPVAFKPASAQRSSTQTNGGSKPSKNSKKRTEKSKTSSNNEHSQAHDFEAPDTDDFETFSVPVPLRKGLTLHLHNMPRDLTTKEAEKIAAVAAAYVSEAG